jgi:ribosome-associated protein
MKEMHIPAKPLAENNPAQPDHYPQPESLTALDPSIQTICQCVLDALDANKAEDIVAIGMVGKSSFADAMIIASGRSPRHVSALIDHVEKALQEINHPVLSIEGKQLGDWVLLDAGDIVVHVFRPEVREFYHLEKMWSAPAADKPDTASTTATH